MKDGSQKTIMWPLLYYFTSEELDGLSRQLAEKQCRIRELESEKKKVTSIMGEMIKEDQQKVNDLAEKVSSGVEERDIECDIHWNHERKTISYYRVDTGELVHTRPMKDDELRMSNEARQLSLTDFCPPPEVQEEETGEQIPN